MRCTKALLSLVLVTVLMAAAVPATAQETEPYHDYTTLRSDTMALAEEYPHIAEFRVVGHSTLGFEIFAVDVALDIGNRSDEELAALPALYVDGGHHGNEILGIEAAYYFLEDVLEQAAEDPSTLEGQRLVVTPVVNPDGYVRDQRQNVRGVDLNRNYPFHWGLYGTSQIPGTPTYRGMAAASEVETQANMALMEELNMMAYLSGHTGTYDLVLPWRASEDGEMPDWPAYEAWLLNIEEETGLEYRDPSGAGESPAWAYGNRTALGLVVEVSEEQNLPASQGEVEERLAEVLGVYHVTWGNLTHLTGSIHVEGTGEGTVTVSNDGWGPAYNVSAGGDAVAEVPAGATVTLDRSGGADEVMWRRTAQTGDEPTLGWDSVPIVVSGNDTGAEGGEQGTPGPSPLLVVSVLLGLAVLRGRWRGDR